MFHLHKSDDGLFYFTLVAKNGKQVMKSGDGYKRKQSALEAIDAVLYLSQQANAAKHRNDCIVDHTVSGK